MGGAEESCCLNGVAVGRETGRHASLEVALAPITEALKAEPSMGGMKERARLRPDESKSSGKPSG